ncbi:MAG: HD domain-containing protein [Haloferacaceae archaeon]
MSRDGERERENESGDGSEGAVREAFPAIDRIADDDLRAGVVDAWTTALDETGWTLAEAPWSPPVQDALDLPDERLVDHVNDVVAGAEALADRLEDRRPAAISRDLLLAAALVHDVSKLYEFDRDGRTRVYDLFGHPYYGIVPAAQAGLPPEVVHVVLSHTSLTGAEPATLEAELVRRADEAAGAAIRAGAVEDLRDAP